MFGVLFQIYRDAGGFRFVLATPYIYLALALCFLLYDRSQSTDWSMIAISVFPSLIGFSLATFAIVLALFGAERLQILSTPRQGQSASPISKLTALIVHSSLVQLSALLIAVSLKQNGICNTFQSESLVGQCIHSACLSLNPRDFFYVAGLFLTMYGLILIISTLLAVFQTSRISQ